MPKPIRLYVRAIDSFNRRVGRFTMYLIFAMMALLLFSSISRTVFSTSYIWIVEMSQFMLTAYYLLGGGYSMQMNSHVRMDLLYGRWSPRRKAAIDALTCCFLVFYLVVLLMGGISSTEYAIEYSQRNYSSWAPQLWPIKIVMCFGITLMLLQALAVFFRDLGSAIGRPLDPPKHETTL